MLQAKHSKQSAPQSRQKPPTQGNGRNEIWDGQKRVLSPTTTCRE